MRPQHSDDPPDMDRQSTRTALALRLSVCAVIVLFVGFAVRLAFRPVERPLHLAINPWPGFEFAPLAEAKGFFRDEGVEVHLVEMASLSDSRRAFELGQVDGFFCTPVEWIVAEDHADRRATAVLVTDASEGADVILVRDPTLTLDGLAGKRVAIERGSLHVLVLAEALRTVGRTIDEVELVHLPAVDAPDAFRAGEVDAIVTYPPFSIDLRLNGEAHAVFSTREIPGRVIDLLVIEESVARKRSDDISRVRRAFFRAQRYAAEHPADALPIMANRFRLSVEAFAEALHDGIHLVTEEEQTQYLGAGGRLSDIMRMTREVLVAAGEIRSDGDAVTDATDREGGPSQ
jgi:NitT/TauT family transport system substrate-binding protein